MEYAESIIGSIIILGMVFMLFISGILKGIAGSVMFSVISAGFTVYSIFRVDNLTVLNAFFTALILTFLLFFVFFIPYLIGAFVRWIMRPDQTTG